jgi:hypothetical protein
MNQKKFKVVIFKNNKKKKVVKSFVTKQRALSYYNDLLNKNSLVKFNKEFENGKRCSYMIGLIFEGLDLNSKFFFTDRFGRNISITSSDFEIIKLNDYLNEDYLFDIKKNKKISYDEFYNSILNKKEISLISKLNNKIIIQNNESIELFSLKNEEDSERIIDILSNEKQKPYLISVDFSIEQRKYLYKLLEDYGFNKKMLYRKTTTHPRE